jgi:hypothetical protein
LFDKDFISIRPRLVAIVEAIMTHRIGESFSQDALIHITGFDRRTNNVTGVDNASALIDLQLSNLEGNATSSNNSTNLAFQITFDSSQRKASAVPHTQCIYTVKMDSPIALK